MNTSHRVLLLSALLLPACTMPHTGHGIHLTISNDTAKSERIRVTVEDDGAKVFDHTARLLPEGAEELGKVVEIETHHTMRMCVTLLNYYTEGMELPQGVVGPHICRSYRVSSPIECMAAAFSRRSDDPYASVSCWSLGTPKPSDHE